MPGSGVLGPRFLPFGHPPLRPFFREDLAFASDLTRPPNRPRAWAAGFIGPSSCPRREQQAPPLRHSLPAG